MRVLHGVMKTHGKLLDRDEEVPRNVRKCNTWGRKRASGAVAALPDEGLYEAAGVLKKIPQVAKLLADHIQGYPE